MQWCRKSQRAPHTIRNSRRTQWWREAQGRALQAEDCKFKGPGVGTLRVLEGHTEGPRGWRAVGKSRGTGGRRGSRPAGLAARGLGLGRARGLGFLKGWMELRRQKSKDSPGQRARELRGLHSSRASPTRKPFLSGGVADPRAGVGIQEESPEHL